MLEVCHCDHLVIRPLFSNIDNQLTTGDLLAIKLPNGFITSALLGQGDKTKPAGATPAGTGHDQRIFDLPNLPENLAQIIGGGIERKISYIESNGHNCFFTIEVSVTGLR